MRVTQIVPSLESRHGGPSVSVPHLSNALSTCGHDVVLLSTRAPGQPTGKLLFGGSKIFRRDCPEAICPSAALRKHLSELHSDVVHHHGLWLRPLHYAHQQARRIRAPLVISPRGMMAPWAWSHRRWKKKLAALFIHPGAMKAASGWHATSEAEVNDIRRLGFSQPICLAPNGVAAPTATDVENARNYWRQICPAAFSRPTALFYARLHPKKRVLEIIDLWLETAPADWLLLLVGIPEIYSTDELTSYVQRNRGADRVQIFDGTSVPPPYVAASLFLLPSHSENFGLTVAEALANGLPVIATGSTPWHGLNESGNGWCVAWDKFGTTLRDALKEGAPQLRERSERARAWVLENFSWQKSAKRLSDFYAELAAKNSR